MIRKLFVSLFIAIGFMVANAGVVKFSAKAVNHVVVKPAKKLAKVSKKVLW